MLRWNIKFGSIAEMDYNINSDDHIHINNDNLNGFWYNNHGLNINN